MGRDDTHVATVMSIAVTRNVGYNVSDGVKFICHLFFAALAVMVPMDLFAYVISI